MCGVTNDHLLLSAYAAVHSINFSYCYICVIISIDVYIWWLLLVLHWIICSALWPMQWPFNIMMLQ